MQSMKLSEEVDSEFQNVDYSSAWRIVLGEWADRAEKLEAVVDAAKEWDMAHPNPQGHCNDKITHGCITQEVLKQTIAALEEQNA